MSGLPLIPKSNCATNHDASHILQEVFQDVLGGEIFPENIVENAEKYAVERKSLKERTTAVKDITTTIKSIKEDMTSIEEDIMFKQAEYLITSDELEKDPVATELTRLKQSEIFKNLKIEQVEKYALLQKSDLLPPRPERSMNFRMNSNRHLCKQPCTSELDLVPSKLSAEKQFGAKELPKIGCIPNQASMNRKRKHGILENNVIFNAHPKSIVFAYYELNTTYEKKFELRNISKTTCSFVIRKLPTSKCFSIQLLTEPSRIAPGITAIFLVRYKTDVYCDIKDCIIFGTPNGNLITVEIESYRDAPLLYVYMYRNLRILDKTCLPSDSTDTFDEHRASALNFTFDCGGCLLGNRKTVSLIMRNEGSNALFFFMTEEEWYLNDVTSVSAGNELSTQEFEICPSYFQADKDEFIEVLLTFFPMYYGLHLEKFYLMCDNCTYEEIDIVGDGIIFEKSFIQLEVPYKHEKLSFMDHDSDYYVFVGTCLSNVADTCIITVDNMSSLELKYHWHLRKSISFLKLTRLKQINEEWIEIKPSSHTLPSDSATDFEVTINANALDDGLYSIVLGFYVDDIPEASLAENTDFSVIEKPKKSDDPLEPSIVDVCIGEIEIAFEVIPVHILIEPPQMIVPSPITYKEEIKKKINISTNGNISLNCKWIIVDKKNGQQCCIRIHPFEFSIKPKEIFVCTLSILPHTYEDISEKLILLINDGTYKKEYSVVAEVIKPKIKFSTNLLNFGYVPKGTQSTRQFFIENLCEEEVEWKILEFTYDFVEKCVLEINRNCMSVTSGTLQGMGDKKEIRYQVRAVENHTWFSFLILVVSSPMKVPTDSVILVTYEVCQPKIFIHSPMSTTPILCPADLLYMGVRYQSILCIHNTGNISGCFLWGRPVGKEAHCVTVHYYPNAGVIKPKDVYKVNVAITALRTGIFEEIFLPCFVGKIDEPVMVRLMCAADNVHVNIYLPYDDGSFQKVAWPPKVEQDFEKGHGTEAIQESEENYDIQILQNDVLDNCHCLNGPEECSHCDVSFESQHSVEDHISENTEQTENVGETSVISEPSIKVQHSSSEITHTSHAPLKSFFGSHSSLDEDYCIEMCNVPLKTPIVRKLIIENITPMICAYSVDITNYNNAEPEEDKFENILHNMGYKKSSYWEKSVVPGVGIAIKVEPPHGEIHEEKSVEIDISVYANTWGIYIEEIMIEINDIAPFCLKLLIEVVGLPLEYPIALNTICASPIIRFGCVSYQSKPLTRKLKIKNISSIPVSVVWHVFRGTKESNPFNAVYEMHEVSQDEFESEFLITSKYYGDEVGTDVFEIVPPQLDIEALSTSFINITFFPEEYGLKSYKTEIEAFLVGYIHVDKSLRFQENYFVRAVGSKLGPTEVKMFINIDMPLLELEHVRGDLTIKAFANEIIKNKHTTFRMRLIFKNVSRASAVLSMHINEPFQVQCLKTLEAVEGLYTNASVVHSGSCVEAHITCYMDANKVLEIGKCLRTTDTPCSEILDQSNGIVKIRRHLNIHQKGVTEQVVPLELVLVYPNIIVSTQNINFGNVFLGNAKKNLLVLKNKFGVSVHFEVILEADVTNFVIQPRFGEIPAARGSNYEEVSVTIHFIPTEIATYNASIRIETITSSSVTEVILSGVGTTNEKFYIEGV